MKVLNLSKIDLSASFIGDSVQSLDLAVFEGKKKEEKE
jgi:hypothetical protein